MKKWEGIYNLIVTIIMNFNCIFLFLSIGSVKTSFSLIISPFGFTNLIVNFPFVRKQERERERERERL